jgi:hypothetical protein
VPAACPGFAFGNFDFRHDVNRLQDKAERDRDRYSATFIDWITLAPGVIRL